MLLSVTAGVLAVTGLIIFFLVGDLGHIARHINNIVAMQLIFSIISMVVGVVAIHLLVTIPLARFAATVKQIANGNLSLRVTKTNQTEIDELVDNFNKLTDQLENSHNSLSGNIDNKTQQLNHTKLLLEEQQQALMNVLEDVSQEKEYEQVQGRSILENILDGIIVTDQEGLIKYMNPALEKIMNIKTDQVKGQDFADTVKTFTLDGVEIEPAKRSDAAAITHDKQEMKVLLQCRRVEKIAVTISAAPIKVGDEYKGVVRVIHDYSEDLALQQQKNDFFSIASHELRTPLTVIAGNIDIVIDGHGQSKLSKENSLLLTDAQTATDRLIKLVNDFLNVSRVDQGRVKAELLDLDACKISEDVVKELKTLAADKDLKLNFTCGNKHNLVQADEGLLKEILINLAGNSIKFTEKGSITISHQETEPGMLRVDITDTGMGIDPEKHKFLFERFHQAMDRTLAREAGGTGLGLYISREFAQLMGGDLVLSKSELGKGATFTLTLPLVGSKIAQEIKTKMVNKEGAVKIGGI
jgi:PAS domain S-box-containing protein